MSDLVSMFDEDASSVKPPSDDKLASVAELARRQVSIEDEIAAIEAALVEKKAALKAVAEVELPEAFRELGLTEFALDTGEKIKVEEKLTANIAADWEEEKRERAFGWLRKNDAEALIKREIVLKFGKGKKEKELQAAVIAAIEALRAPYESKDAVAWNTLTAFVKERKKDGKPIDVELLGVTEFTRAKITRASK